MHRGGGQSEKRMWKNLNSTIEYNFDFYLCLLLKLNGFTEIAENHIF